MDYNDEVFSDTEKEKKPKSDSSPKKTTADIRAELNRLRKDLDSVEAQTRREIKGVTANLNIEPDFNEIEEPLSDVLHNLLEYVEDDLRNTLVDLSLDLKIPSRIKGKWIPPGQIENFYQKAPLLLQVLGDKSRLKILKTLEVNGPLYPTELSELTKIRAGSFSHHMKVLKDEDDLLGVSFVSQEAKRGRYLISVFGREALKFAEVLYSRKDRTDRLRS